MSAQLTSNIPAHSRNLTRNQRRFIGQFGRVQFADLCHNIQQGLSDQELKQLFTVENPILIELRTSIESTGFSRMQNHVSNQ